MTVQILVTVVLLLSAAFFVRAFVTPRKREGGAPPLPFEALGSDGVQQPWEPGEMVSIGVARFGRNAPVLVLSHLLATVMLGAVSLGFALPALARATHTSGFSTSSGSLGRSAIAGRVAIGLVLFLVGAWLQVGLTRQNLQAVRGERVRFRTLLGGADRMFPLVGTLLLYVLAVAVGLVVFIIPGIIFFLAFPLAPFYVIDRRLGPIDAARASWRATEGNYVKIFVVLLLILSALVLGVLAAGVGAYVVVPIALVACAAAYTRMSGHGVAEPPRIPQAAPRFLFAGTAGVLFAASTWYATMRQAHAHARYTRLETVSQAVAVISGVLFTMALLSVVLPLILDRLEKGTFSSYVAARHVRSQKSGFLTAISILSICGVGVSSCALSTVTSVMGGFRMDLERKILGNNAHVVVDTESQSTWKDYAEVLERVRQVKGVVAATPVVHSEVMIWSASNLAGVMVRGVEPETINQVIDLGKNIEVGKFEYMADPERMAHMPPDEVIGIGPGGEEYTRGIDMSAQSLVDPADPAQIDPEVRAILRTEPSYPGIIVGRELAKTLHVYVGDDVTLVSPLGDLGPMGVMPRTKKFRVAAIFYSAMYEYDATQVYTMLDVAQDFFGLPDKISAIDIKVDRADRSDRFIEPIHEALGRADLRVRDWRTMNKSLFVALQTERIAAFVILSIAIMVASFCIICTLLLMVTEKGKEIAILKAIGASDSAIRRTFTTEGLVIGGIGTIFGTATALALCTGLSWFGLKLDPDVYYIDKLPISVNGWDFLAVAVAALTISAISTIYPARAASRLRPVDGLRYE